MNENQDNDLDLAPETRCVVPGVHVFDSSGYIRAVKQDPSFSRLLEKEGVESNVWFQSHHITLEMTPNEAIHLGRHEEVSAIIAQQ